MCTGDVYWPCPQLLWDAGNVWCLHHRLDAERVVQQLVKLHLLVITCLTAVMSHTTPSPKRCAAVLPVDISITTVLPAVMPCSAGLKAYTTAFTQDALSICREACGVTATQPSTGWASCAEQSSTLTANLLSAVVQC
jgi:hypothetical protein